MHRKPVGDSGSTHPPNVQGFHHRPHEDSLAPRTIPSFDQKNPARPALVIDSEPSSNMITTTTTRSFQAFPPRTSSSQAPLRNGYRDDPRGFRTSAGLQSSPQRLADGNPSGYSPPFSGPGSNFTSQSLAYPTSHIPSSSVSSSSAPLDPRRSLSNVSSHISRNSSTRSDMNITRTASASTADQHHSGQPGYVALMRRQKATVWCDRAQHEDPRHVAQQKAAKIRAAREITAGRHVAQGRNSTSGSIGSSTLGVRGKIRHHGVPKASSYNAANLVGGGVPMRLSANEVGDDGVNTDTVISKQAENRARHTRTTSTQSKESRGQAQYLSVDTGSARPSSRRFSGHSPSGAAAVQGGRASSESIPEAIEPDTDITTGNKTGYFPRRSELSMTHNDSKTTTSDRPPLASSHAASSDRSNSDLPSSSNISGTVSSGRGSVESSEREQSFGNLPAMAGPKSSITAPGAAPQSAEDLRRRGSVDERAGTIGLSGGAARLFVVNPDLSD